MDTSCYNNDARAHRQTRKPQQAGRAINPPASDNLLLRSFRPSADSFFLVCNTYARAARRDIAVEVGRTRRKSREQVVNVCADPRRRRAPRTYATRVVRYTHDRYCRCCGTRNGRAEQSRNSLSRAAEIIDANRQYRVREFFEFFLFFYFFRTLK